MRDVVHYYQLNKQIHMLRSGLQVFEADLCTEVTCT